MNLVPSKSNQVLLFLGLLLFSSNLGCQWLDASQILGFQSVCAFDLIEIHLGVTITDENLIVFRGCGCFACFCGWFACFCG